MARRKTDVDGNLLPAFIPNIGSWMRAFLAIGFIIAVALPAIGEKPWEKIGTFMSRVGDATKK